ncbi:MAG: type I restriction endonuclease subunit R [Dehalococcoidia bacterium]
MTTQDKVNELNEAELPAIALLQRLGYTYVPREILAPERDNEREVLLKGRLKAALLRLNPWLKENDAERVIFALENLDAIGMARNQLVHEYLVYGMPLEVDGESGRRTRTVAFFDFPSTPLRTGSPRADRNEFVVTNQMRVRRGNDPSSKEEDDERVVKPDIVLFVNGIPLVVIEAKSPTLLEVWKTRAVRQLRRYQEAGPEWHGAGAPELFDYNLMCIANCGADAAYGTLGARENEYAGWKSVEPYAESDLPEKFGVEAKGQVALIVGMLSPVNLMEMLRDFVVYEPEKGRLIKKLPRYQQFRAVRSAIDRILANTEPEKRGGVVWHTQGSGKSLTMLWLATKLRRASALGNPTIVIVTDRVQLDTQITQTFERCGFPAPEHADNTRGLRKLLSTGAGRTIMTTIQKFEDALKAENPKGREGDVTSLNEAENLFVMVDEAHRTQYGLLGAKMRKALPRATFIGFTGTPIDKGFEKSTMGRFGPLIDQYTIPQSVEDGATVAILYEARLAELSIIGANTLDQLFDAMFADSPDAERAEIRRRFATKEALAEAEKRIESVALDIAEHYKTRVKPNGFKCQVVAPSRKAALKYAEALCNFGISAYPIITVTPDDEGPEFKAARQIDDEQIIGAFKDPDGEPEMLVVVDRLLTGFDAPIEQVLYLDKPLREHGLLQAIARVNRRCTVQRDDVATEKQNGLVVDYYGVSRELETALATFDWKDVQSAMTEIEDDPGAVIESAATEAEAFFKAKPLADAWACVEVFIDPAAEGGFKADVFEKFNAAYLGFAQLMDRFLPDPEALAYTDRLTKLTRIRAYVRAQFLRVDREIDWEGVSAKVKHLIDSRIDAQVRQLMKPVDIMDQEFEAKISELPHDEARASVMEHAIRAQIKERFGENPAFYEKLSQQLLRIIEEMRQRLIDAAEACRRMREVRDAAANEARLAQEQGLSELSFAFYELLAQSRDGVIGAEQQAPRTAEAAGGYETSFNEELKTVAIQIEEAMRHGQSIIDWINKEDVQRVMRRDIKRELRKVEGLSEEQVEELARSMVEVARRKSGRV